MARAGHVTLLAGILSGSISVTSPFPKVSTAPETFASNRRRRCRGQYGARRTRPLDYLFKTTSPQNPLSLEETSRGEQKGPTRARLCLWGGIRLIHLSVSHPPGAPRPHRCSPAARSWLLKRVFRENQMGEEGNEHEKGGLGVKYRQGPVLQERAQGGRCARVGVCPAGGGDFHSSRPLSHPPLLWWPPCC